MIDCEDLSYRSGADKSYSNFFTTQRISYGDSITFYFDINQQQLAAHNKKNAGQAAFYERTGIVVSNNTIPLEFCSRIMIQEKSWEPAHV